MARCVEVGDPSSADAEVHVALDEFSIVFEGAVPSGSVAFEAFNHGEDDHELVIVKADSAEELPVAGGQVQEDELEDGAFIGEIEAFPADQECTGEFALDAGSYVAFCNILEEESDGTLESHFDEGMVTEFTVE